MKRFLASVSGVAFALALLAPAAMAQYRYPGGYGGWGGWGGASTVAGSHAMGMGVYAAGAGAYNEQTAEARSMNANTAMQMNEYMYSVNQRNAKTYYSRLAAQKEQTRQSGEATYQRIHDDPSPHDVHQGDALNAILDDLCSPKVFGRAVEQGDRMPVDSSLVKQIPFQYASQAIMESLDDLVANGPPDFLLTNPTLEADRRSIRAIVAAGRKELEAGRIEPETLAKLREAVQAAKMKADGLLSPSAPERREVDNYLKALFGLTKMLQTPDVAKFLTGLNETPTTSMGKLLTFMHSFNLRFGVAEAGPQQAAYDQLYAMLVQLRDQIQAPASNPFGIVSDAKPDPKSVSNFFSGMAYSHFQPQPDPHAGGTPPPPQPR